MQVSIYFCYVGIHIIYKYVYNKRVIYILIYALEILPASL